MFCQYCGQGVHQEAVVCTGCGCAIQKAKSNEWKSYGWLVVLTILFPIIGVILGIVGLVQGKAKSGTLLLMGLGFWVLWAIILF